MQIIVKSKFKLLKQIKGFNVLLVNFNVFNLISKIYHNFLYDDSVSADQTYKEYFDNC